MYILTQKKILLISPQPWKFIHISKHHYALELCKKDNIVFFLNPPSSKSICINQSEESPNLFIIDYNLNTPTWLRFKVRFLFNLLMKIKIRNILKTLPYKLDIVWCFEPNLYSDLRLFNSDLIIYHLVDFILFQYQIKLAKTAHVVITVSETILQKFNHLKVPSFFINHGLSENFASFAEFNRNKPKTKKSNKICIGYIGNLLIHCLNYNLFKLIISENKAIEFNFWGPYLCPGKISYETKIFIEFLKKSDNVILHGPKTPKEIINEIDQIDAFVLFYEFNNLEYDRSNSHKILEYLSTGKVIISNYIELYNSYPELICMPKDNDDKVIPELFKSVINNIDHFNNPLLQKRRIELALENTYINQLLRIDNILKKIG